MSSLLAMKAPEDRTASMMAEAQEALVANDLIRFKAIIAAEDFDPTKCPIIYYIIFNLSDWNPQFICEAINSLIASPRFNPNITIADPTVRSDDRSVTPLRALFRYVGRSASRDQVKSLFTALLAHQAIDVTIEHNKFSVVDEVPLSHDFIQPLIERGAQPEMSTFTRAKKQNKEVYEYMIKHSDAAVIYAIFMNNLNLLRTIISAPRFKPQALYKKRDTPLMFALHCAVGKRHSQQELLKIIEALITVSGTDINFTNTQQERALTYALVAGLDYVKYLLEHGALLLLPDHYYLAQANGAPGVFDFIRNLPGTVKPGTAHPEWDTRKGCTPPGGTVEQYLTYSTSIN